MTTIKAHFDGRVVVPDEPLNIPSDRPLRVSIELVDADHDENLLLEPLIIGLDPATSRAIAEDPAFAAENL